MQLHVRHPRPTACAGRVTFVGLLKWFKDMDGGARPSLGTRVTAHEFVVCMGFSGGP